MSAEAISATGPSGPGTGSASTPGGRTARGAGRFGRELSERQPVDPTRRTDAASEPPASADATPGRMGPDADRRPMTGLPGERLPEPLAVNLPALAVGGAPASGTEPDEGHAAARGEGRAAAAAKGPPAGTPEGASMVGAPLLALSAGGRGAAAFHARGEAPFVQPTSGTPGAVSRAAGTVTPGPEGAADAAAPALTAPPEARRDPPTRARASGPPVGDGAAPAGGGRAQAGPASEAPARAADHMPAGVERPADLAIRLDPGGRLLSLGVRDAALAGRLVATADQLLGELTALGTEVEAIDVGILAIPSAEEGAGASVQGDRDAGGHSGEGRSGAKALGDGLDARGGLAGVDGDGPVLPPATDAAADPGDRTGDRATGGDAGIDPGFGSSAGAPGGDRRGGWAAAALMLRLSRSPADAQAAAPAEGRAGGPEPGAAPLRRVDIHV